MNKKRAVLLVNLGTPEQATTKSVRAFLKSFLLDKRVVDMPRLFWLPILYLVILPFRAPRVSKLYQKIWEKKGSPLRILSESLNEKVALALEKDNVKCVLAMTYGAPSIANTLQKLSDEGITELTIIPLYPQYSVSTTAPVFDQVGRFIKGQINFPGITFKNNYHDHPLYIDALCQSIQAHWLNHGRAEKLIFSFHGIPQRYVEKGDPYQWQCEQSVALVVKQLGLNSQDYLIAYQSRMGREAWLMPYVDLELKSMANEGCSSVDIICPAFATDCLETLEEMAMQNKKIFIEAGGKDFHYISCLNDERSHIELLRTLALN
ncbi:ferrochelatase [Psychromonas sp. CNPT3]|uniref:ferrochelatase n=1 Tax=Psychromonas sp. CNPT3 TaxID=314282 RepID=UPI0002C14484|nr:ferrochelatase [Psychromonas sp. CNPT3]AGH81911.1 ferrochelatase [Psychromonas sp. CNPT3]